jgi:hypothetical protein
MMKVIKLLLVGLFHCSGIEYCTDYIAYKVEAPFAPEV